MPIFPSALSTFMVFGPKRRSFGGGWAAPATALLPHATSTGRRAARPCLRRRRRAATKRRRRRLPRPLPPKPQRLFLPSRRSSSSSASTGPSAPSSPNSGAWLQPPSIVVAMTGTLRSNFCDGSSSSSLPTSTTAPPRTRYVCTYVYTYMYICLYILLCFTKLMVRF